MLALIAPTLAGFGWRFPAADLSQQHPAPFVHDFSAQSERASHSSAAHAGLAQQRARHASNVEANVGVSGKSLPWMSSFAVLFTAVHVVPGEGVGGDGAGAMRRFQG
jgi:hypothetical protein